MSVNIIEDFINQAESEDLLGFIHQSNVLGSVIQTNCLYVGELNVNRIKPLDAKNEIVSTSPIMTAILDRLYSHFGIAFNHIQINEYLPQSGFKTHVDHKRYGNLITVLSLGGGKDCVMNFHQAPRSGKVIKCVPMTHRSLVSFDGVYRTHHGHEIININEYRIALIFRTV
jgi:alkylated DNA repair dioxygenase AlkB